MEELLCELVRRGPELNREWMASAAGKASHLQVYMRFPNRDKFVETNCDTTAMMLRAKLTPAASAYTTDWVLCASPPMGYDRALFQVSLGSDWTDVEHIFTVVGSTDVLHSWYGKHRLVWLQLDEEAVRTLAYAPTVQDMLRIIGHSNSISAERQQELKIWYWIPPPAR